MSDNEDGLRVLLRSMRASRDSWCERAEEAERERDALRAKLSAVEEWAVKHVEGDGLRRVLWPAKET